LYVSYAYSSTDFANSMDFANSIELQVYRSENNSLGGMIFKIKIKSGPKTVLSTENQRTVSAMLSRDESTFVIQ
jgi:hypothetical protein